MKEKNSLLNCGYQDVLSFNSTMFKVAQLKTEIDKFFCEYRLGQELNNSLKAQNLNIPLRFERRNGQRLEFFSEWFSSGIACEILKIGANGWQKGKIKINLNITLEFCPDEAEIEEVLEEVQSESSLDDIRQLINKNN